MAANSNYYGYSSTVQQPQVYGSQMQSPQVVGQTAYGAQSSAAYGTQTATATSSPYATQQATQSRVMPQTPTAYTSSAASSYQQAAMQGSSYGYTARVQDTSSHPTQSYQTSGQTAYSSQTPSSYYDRDTSTSQGSYDAAKTGSFYGQQHATPSQQAYGYGSTTPATNKTMYPSQSHYSSPSSNTSAQLQSSGGQKSHPTTSVTANVSYPYSTGKHQNSNYNQNSGSYSSSSNWSGSGSGGGGGGGGPNNYQQTQGYDAAVYNAASSYLQQQQPRQKWNNKNNSKPPQPRQKLPPKQQQFHYCDVCKISCAGPQTYKEHLEGQKHKKKEAAAKQMEAGDGYKCSLCDVICTGTEAFNAHLKGAKHLKTVKLHTKLGKPIPDIPSAEVQDKEKKKDEPKQLTPRVARNQQRKNRKPTTPKITFIGGSTLNTSGDATTPEATADETTPTTTTPQEKESVSEANDAKEGKFVGEEYVEEVKSEAGKVVGFECKLCDCKFNDQIAREAHLTGRRHKLSYKKKVQPDYIVDSKPVRGRQQHKPLMDEKARRKWEQDIQWKKQEAVWRQEEVRRWGEEEYWRRLEEEERMWEEQEHHRQEADMMEWGRRHRMGPPRADFAPPDMFSPVNMPRQKQDSQDDRLVMMKHKQIYPNEQELTAVQNIVSAVEKALKLVSDNIADEDTPVAVEVKEEKMEVAEVAAEGTGEVKVEVKVEVKTEETEETEESKKTEEDKKDEEGAEAKKPPVKQKEKRTLKGVMRVGVLAKGLLLHERLDVDLVVLCQDRPTQQLLQRVNTKLPEQLTKVTDEKYDVSVDDATSTLIVSATKEPPIKVVITLTSPVMRDEPDTQETSSEEQKDVLDREKCLEALASLRHAKWFQAKANGVPSCVIIIRVFRDMKDRLASFTPLSSWAMELLVEKCLSSSDQPLGPGEAFRRVLECVASGVILPGGPGLQDPCEKELTDASQELTAQEREDITTAAQHYLRLHAFRQLHKVLGIDPLPPSRFRGRHGRGGRFKRRREDSGQGGDGSAKKEKKDGEEEGGGEEQLTTGETAEETSSAPPPAEETEVKS